ncbi:MAG: efflux RND transporter permease subunit [Phycisphaerales bacterium]|nr:efflux RND transporter permease subunit [Phycisphaerales bacterium]
MDFITFGVKRPVFGSLLMWFLVIGGVTALLLMRREFFPAVEPEAARIAILYPGASPTEVEESMARKIEDAVIDIEGAKRITSNLVEGGGGIVVEFDDGTDIDQSIDDVRIAMDGLQDLPVDAERVRVTEMKPNFPVIILSVYGDSGEEALKRTAQRVSDDLRSMEGMGAIIMTGARPYQLRVDVDRTALARNGLRLSQVADVIEAWMREMPSGTMRTGGANIGVRTLGVAERAEAIRGIPLKATAQGQVVLVGDVAKVADGFADVQVARRFNGKPATSLVIFKTSDEDAVRIAEMVRGYVAGRQGIPLDPGSLWNRLTGLLHGSDRTKGYELGEEANRRAPLSCSISAHNDLARIIEGRLDLLTNDALQGSALVLIVMVLFMNVRAAWWVMSGIFVSIGCTALSMWALDVTLNMVTMFGLLIVVGMLADDAIVVADIIMQRSAHGENADDAAIKGTKSVFWPIVANSATIILAFLPLAYIAGRMGDLLSALPLVAAVALGSSVVETMVILPSHMSHAIEGMRTRKVGFIGQQWKRFESWRESRFVPLLQAKYSAFARYCIAHRYAATSLTLGVLIASLGMVAGGRLPFVFLPAEDAETIIVDIRLPIGSTQDATAAVVRRFETALAIPEEVSGFSSILGQSTNFETGQPDAAAAHVAQIFVELVPVETRTRDSASVMDNVRALVGTVDEAESVTYREISGGPSGTDITYQIRSSDPILAREAARRLKLALAKFEGVYSINDDDYSTQRELQVKLREGAAAMGFTTTDIARQVRGMLYGLDAHTYSADREDIDVRVRLDDASRGRIDSLTDLWISTPQGGRVPLAEIAEITEENSYAAIRRVDRERAITVMADCAANTIPEDITRALAVDLAAIHHDIPEVDIKEAGRQKDLNDAFSSLPYAFLAALMLIYVVLAWLFGTYTQPLAVMIAIPFGFIGVVWGHLFMGYPLTFLSIIGTVALSGIVVNNSLILVEFANERRRGGESLADSLVNSGASRLRPILLTTGTTICGILPLLLEQSFQARFLIPMGIALAAGLLSATMLTLIILPANLLIMEDIRRALLHIWGGRHTIDEKVQTP